MKIAYSWLKDYLKTNKSADELSKILTDIGLEVESVEQFESIKGGLKNIVIGEVLTKTKHPDANKLSLTTVNIGSAVLNIVCGASNVEAGQKVLIATIGTVIHKSNECFTIQKTKIRGAVSEGMICAEDEIGLGESHSGIMVLPSDAPVGLPASQYFNVIEDTVFEIGLTPNRSDATSYIGVAKDLYAALYCKNLINSDKEPASLFLNIPIIDSFSPNLDNINPEIIIEDKQACHRYSGMLIKNIKVSSSPDWLKNKLLASGIRSINNIVDVTNFVMLETGQPLHAFDFDKIKGNKVIIKKYENPFKFVTLDGNEREMTTDDLMICNAEGPMCIAGIFGGQDSGVTDETKTIFLESANFDPKSIHKSSKYHSLTTDSSFRFERGADLEITIFALKRAALILSEISGKDANLYFSDITDIYPKPVQKTVIKANYNNIFRLIGNSIDKNIIIK
ncbi:MAG: phenylalanine--tRNA ligase subunit beta, partial [Bacteroidales bacterium]|nr:phenylalanine--tRNA ligase subunit beta [Bacteroidales bacterium]